MVTTSKAFDTGPAFHSALHSRAVNSTAGSRRSWLYGANVGTIKRVAVRMLASKNENSQEPGSDRLARQVSARRIAAIASVATLPKPCDSSLSTRETPPV